MLGKIKIKIFVVALVAALMTFISTSTLAYYSTVGKATNVVTSGNIQFIIHEMTDQGKEFPKEGVYIVPGDIVSKKVSIESDCEHPFYLRVKMVYGVDSQELSSEDCFKLNIDEEPEVARQFGVMSIPTLVLIKNGRVAATSVGLKPKQAVEEMIR